MGGHRDEEDPYAKRAYPVSIEQGGVWEKRDTFRKPLSSLFTPLRDHPGKIILWVPLKPSNLLLMDTGK